MRIESTSALAAAITEATSRAETKLVAIDGRGGAGKSTLARYLEWMVSDARVVEVDDFWLGRDVRPERARVIAEPGSDYDWPRLRDQVIVPLSENTEARYQRYDWRTDALAEWHTISPGGTVIVEGVFSTRDELTAYYDYRIWVDTPEEDCLARGIARDGGEHDALWREEWMPAYRNYIEQTKPAARADAVIAGDSLSGDMLI